MVKVEFTGNWEQFFREHDLQSFEDIFEYSGGTVINRNKKRDVIAVTLGDGDERKEFFVKRFSKPHFKDMLFTLTNFGRLCSQAACEWKNANFLLQNNIGTYRPVCFGFRNAFGLERESFFMTEKLDSCCLKDFVAEHWSDCPQARKEKIIVAIAKLARKIHDLNIAMPDLYIWHIFLSDRHNNDGPGVEDLAIIDLHRMRINVRSTREKIKDLAALNYSMLDKYFDRHLRELLINTYLEGAAVADRGKIVLEIQKRTEKKKRRRRHPVNY
jgi:hypothetical protein